MAARILMPQGGQHIVEGTVVQWRKAEGESVRKGEILCEVETEKTVFEVESPLEGTLLKIVVPDGEKAGILAVIGIVGDPSEKIDWDSFLADGSEPEEAIDVADIRKKLRRKERSTTGRVRASGRARKLAREKGIDLSLAVGTGPGGRVTEKDVLRAAVAAKQETGEGKHVDGGRLREKEMPQRPYDVIVLGAGAGGVPAAIRAAQLGGRVALVEKDQLGGLCMNRGCVPFGHMMSAAGILGSLSLGKQMGLGFSGVTTDYGALMNRQNELIAFMREGVKSTLKKNGVQLIQGTGEIAEKGTLTIDDRSYSYGKLIVAAGGRWLAPDFPGTDHEDVISSDGLLHLRELPKRALLFGSSPWLIQIAQFLQAFGSRAILATGEKSILPDESKAIRTRLTKVLKSRDIPVWTRVEIGRIKRKKNGLQCVLQVKGKEETVAVDRVIALRRGAALGELGLENAGIREADGVIPVDERLETPVKGHYAIGDATSHESRHYSHLSSAGGIVAAENAMGMESTFDHRANCRVLFTQPQVACVGLTGREAKKAGYEVITGSAPLSMNPFGMITSQMEGLVEVVADKKYEEVLGVHFIGEGAAEMAGQAVLAMQMEATLEELSRAVFPHPTLSESLVEAARDCLGRPIYLP